MIKREDLLLALRFINLSVIAQAVRLSQEIKKGKSKINYGCEVEIVLLHDGSVCLEFIW